MRVWKFILACLMVLTWTNAALSQFASSENSDLSACSTGSFISNCANTIQVGGIEFELVRVLREPGTDTQLRAIFRITNLSATSDARGAIYFPTPEAVDELGNTYFAASVVGLPFCSNDKIEPRFGSDQIFFDLRECHLRDTAEIAMRLPRDATISASLILTSEHSRMFSRELAENSSYLSIRLRMLVVDGTTKNHEVHELFFSRVSLPKEE